VPPLQRSSCRRTRCADRERRGRRQRRLHRTGALQLDDSELVAGVCRERILRHQLRGHLVCKGAIEAARHVDSGEFLLLSQSGLPCPCCQRVFLPGRMQSV